MCLVNKGYGRHVADEAKFLLRSHSDEAWGEKAEEDRGQSFAKRCDEDGRGEQRRGDSLENFHPGEFGEAFGGVQGGLWEGPGASGRGWEDPGGGPGPSWDGLGVVLGRS